MMLCMGCMSEYVSHWVSLWKGRMLSHGATPLAWPVVLGKGEKVGLVGDCAGCGIELHGQASPRETPLMAVRDGGQIGARPFMRTFQRTGMGTMMTLEAWVEGCERMWSGELVSGSAIERFRGTLTEHIAWPAIFAEEFPVLECLAEANEELRPAFQASHLIPWP
jgi:hypothetical protein